MSYGDCCECYFLFSAGDQRNRTSSQTNTTSSTQEHTSGTAVTNYKNRRFNRFVNPFICLNLMNKIHRGISKVVPVPSSSCHL